jgi:pimeloyl-ACP methyl ester carboxylesterase/DNA-binding CsgD family transcriptional regulator
MNMIAPRQQIRFTTASDGVRLAYACSGVGSHVTIKAATWLSHLEQDWESPVWSHLLREMSQHSSFVRYDERGCGLSDWSVQNLSFECWIADLDSIANAAGAERFGLLGISQGAAVAVAYAARHPERVSHLILHGGYARGRLIRSNTHEERAEAEMMCSLAQLGWGKHEPSFRQFFTTQFIPGGTPEQHQWFNEMERLSTSPNNAARFMREFNTIDVTPLLQQVQCPTLVLHSMHDARVPFAEGRLLAAGIPDAKFVPIDSMNHLLLEHEPGWEVWQSEVRQFTLAQTAAPIDPVRQRIVATLSARQLEILHLLAQARDNSQIAALLGLSEKTVRNQVSLIFEKLSVENRSQAIVQARDAGFGIATAYS